MKECPLNLLIACQTRRTLFDGWISQRHCYLQQHCPCRHSSSLCPGKLIQPAVEQVKIHGMAELILVKLEFNDTVEGKCDARLQLEMEHLKSFDFSKESPILNDDCTYPESQIASYQSMHGTNVLEVLSFLNFNANDGSKKWRISFSLCISIAYHCHRQPTSIRGS